MKKLLLIALCASLTSCASIFNSSSETVAITADVENARITITNKDKIPVYNSVLPSEVELKKKAGYFSGETYTIVAQKEGFKPETKELDTTISGWYYANVIFGGFIGWLVADPLTGCMWSFDDDKVHFTMQKLENE